MFGSVPKKADGQRIKKQPGKAFTPLLFDVTDHAALPAAVGKNGLSALINNAWVAPAGPLMHGSMKEVRQAFEINVFGLLAVTQAFLPRLGASRGAEHPPGRIFNLSSISGGVAFPQLTVYAMTKHAVEALSDGLRRELSIYGISVSAIEPGSIKTPISDKVPQEQADSRYAHTDYAQAMDHMPKLVAHELKNAKPIKVVTDAIFHALESPRPKTRYPLIGLWYARKVIPDRLLDRIALKLTRLKG